MLDAMRRQASSWVVKLLLVLLILSFAVWGIGDIFLGRGAGEVVVEVGDQELTAAEIEREFQGELARLREQTGGAFDRQQAVAMGLLNQTLQAAVARALVDQHAQELGIGVSDEDVARSIRESPIFAGSGGFDRQRFELFLRSNGYAEEAFIERVRADIRRQRLIDALRGLEQPPAFLADRLYRVRAEERSGELLLVEPSRIAVEQPTEEELASFLADNAQLFREPERRSGTLVMLQPEDLEDEIAISEDELREVYEQRSREFVTPERRRVGQLLADEPAILEQALEEARAGRSLAEIADDLADEGVTYATIGPATRLDLPTAIADTVFLLEPDQLAEPVESPFGWHLMRLVKILPEERTPFEQVRGELEDELRTALAIDQLPELGNALDDLIAGGASLAEAADELGLELTRFDAIDRQGTTAEGQAIDPELFGPSVLDVVFDEPPGQPSLLQETPDGDFFMVEIEKVEEARPQTLAEAEEAVRTAWLEEQRLEAARERAQSLLSEARSGRPLREIAGAAGEAVTFEAFGPLERAAAQETAPGGPATAEALFTTDEGNLADRVIETSGGPVVLKVTRVIEPEDDAEQIAAIRRELDVAFENDLLAQYEAALRERYPPMVNEAALQALATGGEQGS